MAGAVEIISTIADILPAVVSLLDLFHDSSKKKKDKQQQKVLPPIYINGQTGQPIYYPRRQVGGAAKTQQQHDLYLKLLNRKIKKINIPPKREDVRTAMQYYDKLTPQMKEQLSEFLPEPIINHLEKVYKIFKESPLPPAEKEKALLRYTQKLHDLDNYVLDSLLETLGTKPVGQVETPYVWVQRLTPDGRVKWEFKRRDEVMGYNPLPEAKEDIAEKMARENRLTGKDLYKALPDLYAEELEKVLEEEKKKLLKLKKEAMKKLEYDAKVKVTEDSDKEGDKEESKTNLEDITSLKEPLIQGLSDVEEKERLLEEKAMSKLDSIINEYKDIFEGEEKLTRIDAIDIFGMVLDIVSNYIKPELFDSYFDKRTEEFEDLLRNSPVKVNKKYFRDLIKRTVKNVFKKDRVNPELLK